MKARFYILKITFSLLLVGTTSCLEKFPESAIPQEKAMQTFNDADQQLTGIYASLKSGALWSGYLTLLPDIQSDLVYAVEGYSNTYGQIWQWDILSTNSEIESVYGALYNVISNCNFFLERVGNIIAKETDDENLEVLDVYVGEVHFIRALCYAELIKCFCKAYDPQTADNELGVVLRTKYSEKEPLRRASLKASYELVLDDLSEAEKRLLDETDSYSYVYISKGAAEALHARVALYMQDWQSAVDYASTLIDGKSDSYELSSVNQTTAGSDGQTVSHFYYLWSNDIGFEDIWHINFTPTSYGGSLGSVFLNFTRDYYYFYPDYVPAQWVLNSYASGDGRYEAYFAGSDSGITIGYANGLNWPLLVKYYGNRSFISGYNLYHINQPKVFRLAEQYLIRAEAYCRLGQYQKAGTDLSTLRSARYTTGGALSVNTDNWLKTIADERMRELYMEGFRLHDLKRWGKEYADKNGGYSFQRTPQSCSLEEGSSLKVTCDDPLFVWPIPQHELESPGSEIQPNESN